ncbi:MAG: GNAT family N-acetyltransferase [Candidatus Lokiarchaeota archaeon]|nr:GNAT family N-acetyltransferase [Candidatus Lokiarchaeota archaeon]
MKILLDTNIIIKNAEGTQFTDEIQQLLDLIVTLGHEIYTHQATKIDFERDLDEKHKEKMLKTLGSHQILDIQLDYRKDDSFKQIVGKPKVGSNNDVDNKLLYSLFSQNVDFLITDDLGIHRKSEELKIADCVLTSLGALHFFNVLKKGVKYYVPSIQHVLCASLNLSDPIFDKLKKDYLVEKFSIWWKKIDEEGRKAFVYRKNDGFIGALLILKRENESNMEFTPSLPKKRRVKICSLIVSSTGMKIGELLIKIAVDHAIKYNIKEIYLTHFIDEIDYLIDLINKYGFKEWGVKVDGEKLYLKSLHKKDISRKNLTPELRARIASKFYPFIYDGNLANKFIVPIKPQFHSVLFKDYSGQKTIDEFFGGIDVPGNTIKKAYLCLSNIKKIKKGDILLFYLSGEKKLTALGVVDEIYVNQQDSNEIIRRVSNRTVYSQSEIEEMAKKNVLVIIFIHKFYAKPTNLPDLIKWGVIKRAPQSIGEISHDSYIRLKENKVINADFTLN